MTCPTDMYELTIVVGVIMNYNYLQNYVIYNILCKRLSGHRTFTKKGIKVGSNIAKQIIHLASSSHIWSLCAENHTLTKSKSRSIVSQITNLAYRKTYLVVISPNAYQKLTTSNIRSSWSRFKHCSKSLL